MAATVVPGFDRAWAAAGADTVATSPDSVATPPAPVAAADSTAAPPISAAGPLNLRSPAAAVPDTSSPGPRPFLVMARSAVLPGWGQVYNRQPLKAALVVAGEGYLISKIVSELKQQNEAVDRQDAATTDAERVVAEEDERIHRNRKIDWIWWTAAAHLLQMADAYVDAHFVHFDAEFGPDERAGSRTAPRVTLSLNVRF